LEQTVSKYLGHPWKLQESRDMTEFACHPCAILSGCSFSVFAKFSDAPNGLEQFEIELAGLRLLSGRAGILTPSSIGVVPVPAGSLLIMETVQAVERRPRQWREIGQTLACLHQVKGDRFGFDSNGYFGPLYQDNTPADTWLEFFKDRRLLPGLQMAVVSGNLPDDLVGKVEKLVKRLPEICGREVVPALLHGDAQQNNFISSPQGAVVIDPAVYFGHPEMDLAYVDYFQPVPGEVFEGYQELLPIDPGFWERRELWRIWGYLAAVTVEGAGYVSMLKRAVEKYL
jgi:protein-ribulosamine 3-kinase